MIQVFGTADKTIVVGESIVAGTNVTETTVMAEVLSLIQ